MEKTGEILPGSDIWLMCYSQSGKLLDIAHDEDHQHYQGKHDGEIVPEPSRHPYSGSGVDLLAEPAPAHAALRDDEENVYKGAYRNDVVAYEEIQDIEDLVASDLNEAPDIEAQDYRQ